MFRLFAKTYVYTVHNVLPHGKSNDRFYRQVYRILYRLPHVLLAHGEHSAQMLRHEFNVPLERIHIVPIGLNEEVPITGMTRGEARQVLGIDQDAPVVLFFGRIHPSKGLDVLIRALPNAMIDGLTLVVAGACLHPSYLAEVERLLSGLAGQVRVVLHSHFIPNEAVETYFASADVLALPYREISQSGVPLLALAFGLPVIATDVGSMREYVNASSGIITPSNNVPRLAEAMHRFFQGRRDFDREAIARDARKYAWGNVARNLATLYRRMGAAR
jgi:glycosyltransferase involved in cell wall biosynthesis